MNLSAYIQSSLSIGSDRWLVQSHVEKTKVFREIFSFCKWIEEFSISTAHLPARAAPRSRQALHVHLTSLTTYKNTGCRPIDSLREEKQKRKEK